MIKLKEPPLVSKIQFAGIVVMTIVLFLIVDYGQRASTSFYVSQAEAQLKADIAVELTRQAQLTARRDYVSSREYVEKWAREKAHMVLPGDKPMILVTVEVTPAADNAVADAAAPDGDASPAPPTGVATPEPAWRQWWRLFFDSEPGALYSRQP